MTAEQFFSWWNLIFIVPFFLALLYLVLYAVSGISFGEAGADGAGHVDDIGAGVEGDFDIHLEADGAMKAGAGTGGVGIHADLVGLLGIGRVPLSVVLMVLAFSWGAIGFITNALLLERWGWEAGVALASIPVAAAGSLVVNALVVRFVGRFLPLYGTSARRKHALLGSEGEAIFAIGQRFGMASVRDEQGEIFQVPCRIFEQQREIAKGERVVLVGYNAKEGLFYVAPREPSEARARA